MKKLFELVFKMTFTSPHFSLLFLLLLDFFFLQKKKKKKGDQTLSQHIKVFYLSYWTFTLSPLEGLAPSFKTFFFFFFQMGLAPSLKVPAIFFIILKWALPLVQRIWSAGSKRFHLLILIGLLVNLPMSLGFRASKLSQSMEGFDIFSIKPITYTWSWALLLLKNIFELWPIS